ncbi:MAG: YceI family protein [Chloroflexi bacterium]|nr:YceI family protein [Chloroflexota bacterium]MDA1241350.1 YceI family protein [Chloroflexota bacterium]
MTTRIGLIVAVAAVVAVAAFGGWYALIRDTSPPPVSLAEAVAALGTSTPATVGASGTATSTTAPSATAPATGEASSDASGMEGTWALVAADSFVGYRVREELANVGATTAVGRTSTVSGALNFDGAAITSVEIVADLRDLRSDDDRRDGQLRQQALESSQFPEASFVLAEPIALDGVPAEGDTVNAIATGDLTLHGVTNRVQIPVEGQFLAGNVVVVGSLEIVFADYGISQPRSMLLLSVDDRGVMELQLVFARG